MPTKKLKGGKNADHEGSAYFYYDDFETNLVQVAASHQKAQNVIHIDLNIEPHNEQDDHYVYNARAVAWLRTEDFFSYLDNPIE